MSTVSTYFRKKIYCHRGDALLALETIAEIFGDSTLHAYQCPRCRQWHLGHQHAVSHQAFLVPDAELHATGVSMITRFACFHLRSRTDELPEYFVPPQPNYALMPPLSNPKSADE